MRARSLTRLVAAAALGAAMPLHAEDGTTPSAQQAEAQRVKDETDLLNAQTAQFKARTERLKAETEALGLPKPEGKTTLEAEAGKLEGWMLASATLNVAAAHIDARVARWVLDHKAAAPVVLLDADDVLDLRTGVLMRAEIATIEANYQIAVLKAKCSSPQVQAAAAAGAPATALIGTILSLLKTDTKISGFSFDTAEGALINAVAGAGAGRYVIPADLSSPGPASTTLARLAALVGARDAAEDCRIEIEAAAGDDANAKKAAAARVAPLVALAARSQAWLDAASERKDGKPSRLELAMTADALLADGKPKQVLRVRVERAGGSLLQRSNLFTMLGAPAVGITGGTVISWRLSSASDGTTGVGGILVCRTKLTNLNAIHAGRVDVNDSSCGDSMAGPPAGLATRDSRQGEKP